MLRIRPLVSAVSSRVGFFSTGPVSRVEPCCSAEPVSRAEPFPSAIPLSRQFSSAKSLSRQFSRPLSRQFSSARPFLSAKPFSSANPHLTVMSHIQLDQTEQKIQSLLVKYASEYRNQHQKQVVLRITGGWVRDKLLGKQSHDLDIAVDIMSGLEFAEGLNQYISQNAAQLGIEPGSIHTIEKNPEKSKHLETATTRLYGLDIDFVNLRSEEYAEDSRIPQIKFGTPQEDAYRRDATLNALFYNMMDQKIEDFTGKGLEDLENGVLRTPLQSFDTFNEDPLRVLRLLRFASTFGFSIDGEALDAMRDHRIKLALAKKISRERVGVEIAKLLAGQYPEVGLNLIADLGLEDSIFHLLDIYHGSGTTNGAEKGPSNMKAAIKIMAQLKPVELAGVRVLQDQKLASIAWIMTALNRWGNTQAVEKKKPVSAAFLIVREGLKWPANDGKLVEKLILSEPHISRAAASLDTFTRKDLGLLVRSCGEHWRLAFIYCMLKQALEDSGRSVHEIVRSITELSESIMQLGLVDAWNLRPLANGNDIKEAFDAKAGKWMSQAVDKCIEYQLQYPEASKAECLDYLVGIKQSLLS